MPTKTITVDMAAYDRLIAVRRGNESFSRTIKRVIRPPLNIEAYLSKLADAPLSREAGAAIEEHIDQRHRAPTRHR